MRFSTLFLGAEFFGAASASDCVGAGGAAHLTVVPLELGQQQQATGDRASCNQKQPGWPKL